jgi:hypothetical protein
MLIRLPSSSLELVSCTVTVRRRIVYSYFLPWYMVRLGYACKHKSRSVWFVPIRNSVPRLRAKKRAHHAFALFLPHDVFSSISTYHRRSISTHLPLSYHSPILSSTPDLLLIRRVGAFSFYSRERSELDLLVAK